MLLNRTFTKFSSNFKWAKLNILDAKYMSNDKIKKIGKKIGFIGDGNMAKAICKSIKEQGLIEYSQVYVSSPYIKNLDSWKEIGANVTTNNAEVAEKSDVIFLAVKPHVLGDALQKISEAPNLPLIKNKLFISILAGLTLDILKKMLSKFEGARVVRVMPNTSMVVGQACSVYCPDTNVTEEDLAIIKSMLEVTGFAEMIPENLINVASAISASGPAFVCIRAILHYESELKYRQVGNKVYMFIEALSDGGVRLGLHRELSTKLSAQTVLGAAKMVLEANKHMGVLKDEVCSAGGQTIAGVHHLELGGMRGAVINAIYETAKRAAQLGKTQ